MEITTFLTFEEDDKTKGFAFIKQLESEGWIVDTRNSEKRRVADYIEHRILLRRSCE